MEQRKRRNAYPLSFDAYSKGYAFYQFNVDDAEQKGRFELNWQ